MSYKSITIENLLGQIEANKICLPSIQREFVWADKGDKKSKIEKLFDSIYRGYPIGSFLFWELNDEILDKHSFYRTLTSFNENENRTGAIIPKPYPWPHELSEENKKLTGVLDGQQRITSLSIGFLGSHTIGKPGKQVERFMHFNLLAFLNLNKSAEQLAEENMEEETEDRFGEIKEPKVKIFKLLSRTEKEIANRDANLTNELWIQLNHLRHINWNIFKNEDNSLTSKAELRRRRETFAKELLMPYFEIKRNLNEAWFQENKNDFIDHLETIINKIKTKEIIGSYNLEYDGNLIDITEVFIRINQGETLSKIDLLYSTLVANWEIGKGYIDTLEKYIKDLKYPSFRKDFILRTCLYLSERNVFFKVDSFDPTTILKIQSDFKNIYSPIDYERAIKVVFEFLKQNDIKDSIITSNNAVIPLIYHVFKGGNLSTQVSKKNAIEYIYVTMLQKVFGSHGDIILENLRDASTNDENELLNQEFNYQTLINGLQEDEKKDKYNINLETIDRWLLRTKPIETLQLLSLIKDYVEHEGIALEQDHLHPKSTIKRQNFEHLSPIEFNEINNWKDTVGNLCLVPENFNRKKSDISLFELINNKITTQNQRIAYKNYALIDEGQSLELRDFREFFQIRKAKIRQKLIEKFNINEEE
jgi:hypothetical protein